MAVRARNKKGVAGRRPKSGQAELDTRMVILAAARRVFANTGVRMDNVRKQLAVADGAVVGTAFKVDGNTWNAIEPARVKAFMDEVKAQRKAGK